MTPELISLKQAFGETVKGVGGLEAAANFCRVGKSALSDNQSVNKPESFPALDVVYALEPLARDRDGWPHVTRALCRQMGGVFVPEPVVPPSETTVLEALSDASREFSEVTAAVCAGMSDGRFCRDDAAKLAREIDDVIAKAVNMRALARSIMGEGK